jgi:hypothetical protein
METRLDKLHSTFTDYYGEDLDDVRDLINELIVFYSEANDEEIVEYVIDCIEDSGGEVGDIDALVNEFENLWGKK